MRKYEIQVRKKYYPTVKKGQRKRVKYKIVHTEERFFPDLHTAKVTGARLVKRYGGSDFQIFLDGVKQK